MKGRTNVGLLRTGCEERLGCPPPAVRRVMWHRQPLPRRCRLSPSVRVGSALGPRQLRLPLSSVRGRSAECVAFGERIKRHGGPEFVETCDGTVLWFSPKRREVGGCPRSEREQQPGVLAEIPDRCCRQRIRDDRQRFGRPAV